MATQTLTVKGLEAIRGNGTEFYLWDDKTPGLGVRVNEVGEVFFVTQFRVKDTGKRRRLALGRYGQLTLEQARERARAHISAALDGRDLQGERAAAAQEKAQRLTLNQLADVWMAQHVRPKRSANTYASYEGFLARVLRPKFGTMAVEDIRRTEVLKLHHAMAMKPRSANYCVVIGKALINFGIRAELLPADLSNPFEKVEHYKTEGRERFLSNDELARVGAALSKLEGEGQISIWAAAAIRLLLLTGARSDEIFSLRWVYVDFERGILALKRSKTGRKTIALNDHAVGILRSLPRVEGNPHVIVGAKTGEHLTTVRKAWALVLAEAGIEATRVHDLRHSFASFAIGDGVSLAIVGRLLGHTNPQTTQRYAHLADDVRKRANDLVGAKVGGILGTAPFKQHADNIDTGGVDTD